MTEPIDLDALGAADDEAVIFVSKRKLDALIAELRAARKVVAAARTLIDADWRAIGGVVSAQVEHDAVGVALAELEALK